MKVHGLELWKQLICHWAWLCLTGGGFSRGKGGCVFCSWSWESVSMGNMGSWYLVVKTEVVVGFLVLSFSARLFVAAVNSALERWQCELGTKSIIHWGVWGGNQQLFFHLLVLVGREAWDWWAAETTPGSRISHTNLSRAKPQNIYNTEFSCRAWATIPVQIEPFEA